MQVSRILVAACVIAGAMSPSLAFADIGPWYIGAGVGATRYGGPSGDDTFVHAGEFSPASFTATEHTESSATSFRLDAGYRLDRYFALEGTYADFGSASSSFTTTSPYKHYTGSSKISGEGFGAVGFLPVTGDLELFGRAGLFHFKSDVNQATVYTLVAPGSPPVVGSAFAVASTSGTTEYLGAGADYALDGGFLLRAAWDYFRAKDQLVYGPSTAARDMIGVHVVSIELLYNF